MKIVIDIHEKEYQSILNSGQVPYGIVYAIMNGTSLDKHDEEVIAETVESIWGKPPYIELLDKIRAEMVELWQNEPCAIEHGCLDEVLKIIDKYKVESEEV